MDPVPSRRLDPAARTSSGWPPEDEAPVKTVIPLYGTDDVLVRVASACGYRWVEIKIDGNGYRSVWDASIWFDDQQEALTWLATVDPDLVA
jgi:hypothetical protein